MSSPGFRSSIRHELKTIGISVVTGKHVYNRIVSKRVLQADTGSVVQIDSCRLASVSEVLAVLRMTAKFGGRYNICPQCTGRKISYACSFYPNRHRSRQHLQISECPTCDRLKRFQK